MKKLILLGLIFIACKKQTRLETAKEIAMNILLRVDSIEKGYITKNAVYPAMLRDQKRLDSIRLLLSPAEVDSLDAYRTRFLLEIVNRRVNRNALNDELR